MTRVSRPATGRNITGSRTEPKPQLSDEQWLLIKDLFPEPPANAAGGRPRVAARECLEGILWVLRTGARWKDLPTFLPSPSTCWRRFKEWTEEGVFLEAWQRLLEHFDRRKLVVWSEAFGEGTFCPAKKKAPDVGKTKRGKGTKLMLLVDGNGLPLALDRTSASPAEVKLIESLLDQRVLPRDPDRLIYDRVADCDPLRTRLAKRQIELICPHRKNRVKPATQDGRALRRYRRRWKVERTISWLFNFRRLVVRYERYSHLFLGFAQLAGVFTLLNKL
ncbi:IS5 family transposase [Gimesia algae]|uniref:IS5 family transposase n=1 Tax=Gimesia algae TaxID=2527971 RepID=UPI0036F23D7E